MQIDTQFVLNILAVVIIGGVIGLTFFAGHRAGLKGASSVLASVNGNQALLTSIEALGKSVPQEAVTALLAALGIGEAVTPNQDLRDLLEEIKTLVSRTTDGLPNDPPPTTTTTTSTTTTVLPNAVG